MRMILAESAFLFVPAFPGALPLDHAAAALLALSHSPDLHTLEDRALASGYMLKLGLRDYLPQLSLGYLDSSNIVVGGPDAASIQWSATVKQPLFDGGRTRRRHRLAEADLVLQERSIKEKRLEIVDAVESGYDGVLMRKRKLGIQRDTLAITEQELSIARAKKALGGLREIDLLESELQRSALEISIASAEADLEESEFSLKQLVGLNIDAALELVDDFDSGYEGVEMPKDSRSLEALALKGNLELRQKQAELKKKAAALVEASAWYLPKVSLEGSLSLSGERYPLQSASMSGKLVFEIPVPNSPVSFSVSSGDSTGKQSAKGSSLDAAPIQELSSLAEEAAAKMEYAVLRRSIEDMNVSLKFEVKKNISAYVRDKAALELQRQDLGLQRKKAEIQKRLVDIGEATLVDYLKTLATAAEGESAVLESVLKLRKSERGLERLLGLESGNLVRLLPSLAKGGR
jgi:outer membrane protein TolC